MAQSKTGDKLAKKDTSKKLEIKKTSLKKLASKDLGSVQGGLAYYPTVRPTDY